MDEITGRDLNDDDLRMEAEIVATEKSKDDDEPDGEAAEPQSADDEADNTSKDEAQDADESKKDEKNKGDENDDAGDEKPETEIV